MKKIPKDKEKISCSNHWYNNRWLVYSRKNNKRFLLTSDLEYANFLNAEMDSNIKSFEVQTPKIEANVEGEDITAVFDMAVTYFDGSEELREVKYTSDFEDARVKRQFEAEKAYCKNNHIAYKIMTEKNLYRGNATKANL